MTDDDGSLSTLAVADLRGAVGEDDVECDAQSFDVGCVEHRSEYEIATVVEEAAARVAVEGLGATLDPPSDVHASADYRRNLAETAVVRAVLQAAERAKG